MTSINSDTGFKSYFVVKGFAVGSSSSIYLIKSCFRAVAARTLIKVMQTIFGIDVIISLVLTWIYSYQAFKTDGIHWSKILYSFN